MDVRMPDGTIIRNVPEGTTKAQLESRLAKLPKNAMEDAQAQLASRAEPSEPGFLNAVGRGAATRLIGLGQTLNDLGVGEKIGLPTNEILNEAVKVANERGKGTGVTGIVGEIVGDPLTVATLPMGGAATLAKLAAQGAAIGAAGGLTAGMEDSSLANRAVGGTIGAGIGATVPVVAKGVGKVLRPFTTVDGEAGRLAQVAEKEGIALTPAQKTGSKALRGVENAFAELPLTSGAQSRIADSQARQFNRAVLRRAGIDADTATPEVLAAGKKTLSDGFEGISARTTLNVDDELLTRLANIEQEASRRLGKDEAKAIQSYIDDVKGFVRPDKVAITKGGEEFIDTRGLEQQFHGTSRPISSLSDSYAMSGDSRNIYGQGFYTTDAVDIARGYSTKGKGESPTLYSVVSKEVPLYDLEQPMTDEVRQIATRVFGDYMPSIKLDGKPVSTLRDVLDEFRSESANEGFSRYDVQDYFNELRTALESKGFRGYKHAGGMLTKNKQHTVKILWHPEQDAQLTAADFARYTAPTGKIDGRTYQNTRSRLGQMAKGTTDGFKAGLLKDLQSALDDAAFRSLSPQDVAEWMKLRQQYGAYKTVEKAMSSTGQNTLAGNVSPAALATAAKTGNKNYATGAGELNDLARTGATFLRDPVGNSGTSQRLMWQGLMTGGTGIGAAYGTNEGGLPGGIAGAATVLALPRLIQKGYGTKAVQNYLTRGAPASVAPSAVTKALTAGAAISAGRPKASGQPIEPQVEEPMPPESSASPLMDRIAMAESGGDPNAVNPKPGVTASGLLGFNDDTWTRAVAKWGKQLGITLQDRMNPEAQLALGEKLAEENARILSRQIGREPTDGEIYIAHALGAPDAKKLLAAQGTNKAAIRLFPRKVVESNREWFFDGKRPRSVEEVYQLLSDKVA